MAAPKILEDRNAWLEMRRNYLGGTDVAALVHRNKYSSPFSVYADKVLGQVDLPDDASEAAEMGLLLEPIVKRRAERECGWVLKESKTYFHPQYPFLGVNPDAELGSDALVEIKTHGFRTASEWGEENTDQIPDAYHVQCIWQLGITGRKVAFVVAYDTGLRSSRYYRVDADPDYFAALVKIAVTFWNEHIVKQIPPPATGHDADADAISRIYPRDADYLVTATPEIDDVAAELIEIRKAKKEIETKESALKTQIQSAIGDAQGIVTMSGKILWKSSKDSVKTDWKGLCAKLMTNLDTSTRDLLIADYSTTQPGARRFEFAKEAK